MTADADLLRVEREIFARAPEHDIVPSLDRISAVVDLLGQPQRAFPAVHVTGTNGKTSTTRMVESLLRAFGLRTGRFTSPHLHTVRERIAFDGTPIEAEAFVSAYADVLPYVELVDARGGPRMTFFEVLVAMAYAAFADAPVDVAAVEVGMGGVWDATNVLDGQVAVVTPVGVDHTRFLGSTVEEIASEKAGIIKSGAAAVLSRQQPSVADILLERVRDVGATAVLEGVDFGVVDRRIAVGGQQLTLQGLAGTYGEVLLPLHGEHQARNAACALAAVESFLGGGRGQLDPEVVREGFAATTSPGRLEVLRRSPTVVLDGAHNPAGAAALAAAISDAFSFTRLVGVVGVLADKDVHGILAALEPVLAEVVVTESASGRSLPVDDLAAAAVDVFGEGRVEVVVRLDDAIDTAIGLAEEEGEAGGGVLVTGSLITVAEARTLLGGGPA